MIPADLLSKLREADPELWKEFNGNAWVWVDVLPEFKQFYIDSILQSTLQEAIRARGWQGIILFSSDHYRAVIEKFTDGWGGTKKLAENEGDTEAEALCLAYMAAIEAVKG